MWEQGSLSGCKACQESGLLPLEVLNNFPWQGLGLLTGGFYSRFRDKVGSDGLSEQWMVPFSCLLACSLDHQHLLEKLRCCKDSGGRFSCQEPSLGTMSCGESLIDLQMNGI